jgi:hypothetical protein
LFHGPTVSVLVGKLAPPNTPPEALPTPQLVHALIDTGATDSCIDDAFARTLKLPVIDRSEVDGVGGRALHNVYLAHVNLPELGTENKGPFIGVDLSSSQRVILGRDFLRDSILIYNGPAGSIILAR